MKCSNCGSEWSVSVKIASQISKCTFCNMPLTRNDNTIKSVLRWVVEDRGLEVFNNSNLLNGILGDLVKDEEKEKRKIRLALSCGAGTLFYKIVTRSNGSLLKTDIREFQINLEDCGFSEDFIDYILNSFLYAISYSTIYEDNTTADASSYKNCDRESSIKTLTQSQSNKGRYLLKSAILLYSQKNYKAKNAFFEALNCGEDLATVYLGRIEKERGNYKKALEWFLKAAESEIGEGAFCAAEIYYEEYLSNNTQLEELYAAQKYYKLAVSLGYQQAKEKLDLVQRIILYSKLVQRIVLYLYSKPKSIYMKRISSILAAAAILAACGSNSSDKQIIENFYNAVLGRTEMTDALLKKSLSDGILSSLWEADYPDTYSYWAFRTGFQDGPGNVSQVDGIESLGDGWYRVSYQDMGTPGVTEVKVEGGKITDYRPFRVPYTQASNYYKRNDDIEDVLPTKITSQEQLNQFFGMAAFMWRRCMRWPL